MASPLLSRSQIGLRHWTCRSTNIAPEGLTVHYSGNSPWGNVNRSSAAAFRDSTSHARCLVLWRAFQADHMNNRGGCDIFYSSGVCPHGYRLEGRGPGVRSGAQGTNSGNYRSYGVQYIAGGSDPLTNEAKRAFHDEAARYRVPLRWGHRDWKSTACPGSALYNWRQQGFPRPGGTTSPPSTGGLFMHLSKAEEKQIYEVARTFNDRVNMLVTARLADFFKENNFVKLFDWYLGRTLNPNGVKLGSHDGHGRRRVKEIINEVLDEREAAGK